MAAIPQNYDEWEHCITVACGIPLTKSFVEARIAALQDAGDSHTRRFIELWGDAHHAQTLAWFREAEARLGQ